MRRSVRVIIGGSQKEEDACVSDGSLFDCSDVVGLPGVFYTSAFTL